MAEGQEYAPPGPDDIIDAAVAVNPNPIQFQSYADAASALGTNAEETQGPDHVFQILEDAVPRPDETTLLSPEEQTRRRELVDQTWDQVRRWLYAHEGQEDRAAAAMIRGQGDATILHLMCRMSNPPPDIISDIIDAAPDVVSWPDTHGWLPLHHACAYGASPEVYEILTQTYPESKLAQDNQNRTPLHFYATRNSDNPAAAAAMADTVHLLADTGAAELPDRGGMLPMHYACAYGTSPAVLKVLADCYPESFTIKENNGRTPMHLAMVNAHRDASPGVIKFLLDEEGKTTVDMRDHEGNLPLHLLALGLRGLNYDEQDKLNNVAECLKLYLAAEPVAPPDFLTALQDLPDWLQDVAVVSPHVRSILNKKIVQRFPTSFLMLDGYFLIFLIVFFEITTTDHIKVLFDEDADIKQTWNERTFEIICLFIGAGYFLGRELIQIISLISLGSFSSWFADATNWLDMAVITMVLYYAILMTGLAPIGESEFRSGVAFTKGVLWMAVISFLKSTLVDFAVFVGGVFYVVQRLVAFLLAVGVILLAFAQMFFIVYRQHPVCQQNPISDVEYEEEFGFEPCNFPHCSFEESLLKVYTMMMVSFAIFSAYMPVLD
jgi:ankyrin repeat protein